MAESTVSSTTETEVISTLLVSDTQNRRSGRVSTAFRLSSVGGQGGDAGEPEILSPGLNAFASTRYSGTKKTALRHVATSGRSHGKRPVTGPPPGPAGCAAPPRWRSRR